MISFLFHQTIAAWLFLVSLPVAVGLNFLFAEQLGTTRKSIVTASFLSLVVLAVSFLLSWFYFDLSWDGQWYQQAAIYDIADKWNPLLSAMELPGKENQLSVLHFPKNGWYFGAALLRLTGNVEMGKAYNFLLLFAAWGSIYSFCRDFKMKVFRSLFFTTLVLINPVVFSEITTFLNDGDLYLLLIIYVTAVISWLKKVNRSQLVLAGMALICVVNTKFTGLVFLMIVSFTVFIYVLAKKRNLIKLFLASHVVMMVLAVCVFGFNPYITNTLKRGNPLYPLIGSKEFPGVFDKGSDDNEAYETPKNMVGKSLIVRLFYANFGRPGNAPYNGEDNAILNPSLLLNPSTWSAYHYHETRVSGFGPYFGILLLITMVVLPLRLINSRQHRLPVILFVGCIFCCISLSRHFWWPRFFPLLWLAPLLPVWLIWVNTDHKNSGTINYQRRIRFAFNGLLPAMIFINGCIVTFVHLGWETNASLTLRAELSHLQHQPKPIVVDYGYFKRSVEEKLNWWHIDYKPGKLQASDPGTRKLTSVVEGYPNTVLFR